MSNINRIFFIILLLSFGVAYADKISAPPILQDEPVAEQLYFQEIYNNFHKLEVTTTNPDGARSADKGSMIFLQTGGNSFLEINSNGSTEWLGVQLTNTP